MSEDPSGFAAGDLNPYQYVGNNPVSLVDPSGLGCLEDCDRMCKLLGKLFEGAGKGVELACKQLCKQQGACRAEECKIKRISVRLDDTGSYVFTFCQQCPWEAEIVCDEYTKGNEKLTCGIE